MCSGGAIELAMTKGTIQLLLEWDRPPKNQSKNDIWIFKKFSMSENFSKADQRLGL
ncbi:hypothetical protein HNR46_000537 [Haloferula luteola]|uniref:Uncharacterized protein n=1 Tax=Haloferula luteola TaxID=595692 RepID=A0A840UZ89_9BACT|nr:hypothetical protein [Haloferula luteola]